MPEVDRPRQQDSLLVWANHGLCDAVHLVGCQGSSMEPEAGAMASETELVSFACEARLDLANAKLPEEFQYNSLPLCAIDAVFSIGVNYRSVQNTVANYCDHFRLPRIGRDETALPPKSAQESVSTFCDTFESLGLDAFVSDVFRNRQRTSTRNGILKAQAVYEFCMELRRFGVEYLQDVDKVVLDGDFDAAARRIRGQGSGVSLSYFFMLAGSDDLIKPDRWILRFLCEALSRPVATGEALALLRGAAQRLSVGFPHITPRLLDYKVWDYQRAISRGSRRR